MSALWQDLRYSARSLAQRPALTALAIFAIALGIGATTVIFSSVNALVLRPLPFPELDRVVALWSTLPREGSGRFSVAPADFRDYRDQTRAFAAVAAYRRWDANLTGVGDPARLRGLEVTGAFFPLLGMEPLLGRTLAATDAEAAAAPVVVLAYGFWRRQLGGDPGVVGRTLEVDGRERTVVGVLPPEFNFPLGTDLWAPLVLSPAEWQERRAGGLRVLARLADGVSLGGARSEVAGVAARLAELHPETCRGRGVQLVGLREDVAGGTGRFVVFLMGAAAFVLLLASTDVVNLQLARASGRRGEIALRLALGASRARVIRQLVAESLLLFLLGGLFGMLLAPWGVDVTKASVPESISRFVVAGLADLRIDGRVLAFTLMVTLASGLLAGLVPAVQVSRPGLGENLKEGGRSATAGRRPRRLRHALVVVNLALALVLLVGAGLMVEGFRNLLAVDRGFVTDDVLTLRTSLAEDEFRQQHQVASFYRQALDRIAGLPEVRSAALVSDLPAFGAGARQEFRIAGRAAPPAEEPMRAGVAVVSDAYFRTLGIPLVAGRLFGPEEGPTAPPVAVVSRALAARWWPGEEPLGRHLRLGPPDSPGPWRAIVGVVGDVSRDWLRSEPEATVYLPYLQAPLPAMSVVVATVGDPYRIVPAVRREVRAVKLDQPIYDVRTLETLLAEWSSGVRLAAATMGVFAVIALLLGAAGIYGTVAYAVNQRLHETGVRMALGAGRREILQLFVGQGARLAGLGLAIGLAAALALAHLLSSFLYGVIRGDVATFAGFTAILFAVALFASYRPARRAALADPAEALRYE